MAIQHAHNKVPKVTPLHEKPIRRPNNHTRIKRHESQVGEDSKNYAARKRKSEPKPRCLDKVVEEKKRQVRKKHGPGIAARFR